MAVAELNGRRPVGDLIPDAVRLAVDTGTLPSRNRLMVHHGIGSVRAGAVRTALESAGVDWATIAALAAGRPDLVEDLIRTVTARVADPTGGPPSVTATPDPVHGDGPAEPDPGTAGPGTVALPDPIPTPDGPDPVPAPDRPTPPPSASDLASADVPDAPVSGGAGSVRPAPADVPTAEPRPVRSWPMLLLALPAFVAIWSGWVGLGGLTGFGVVHPLPGIADSVSLNTAITLPIGVETYAAYALRVWLSGTGSARARRFAKWSALGSLLLGAAGQVAYHLMQSAGMSAAPWWITTLVACLPVAVLGMGAGLIHLIRTGR